MTRHLTIFYSYLLLQEGGEIYFFYFLSVPDQYKLRHISQQYCFAKITICIVIQLFIYNVFKRKNNAIDYEVIDAEAV